MAASGEHIRSAFEDEGDDAKGVRCQLLDRSSRQVIDPLDYCRPRDGVSVAPF